MFSNLHWFLLPSSLPPTMIWQALTSHRGYNGKFYYVAFLFVWCDTKSNFVAIHFCHGRQYDNQVKKFPQNVVNVISWRPLS